MLEAVVVTQVSVAHDALTYAVPGTAVVSAVVIVDATTVDGTESCLTHLEVGAVAVAIKMVHHIVLAVIAAAELQFEDTFFAVLSATYVVTEDFSLCIQYRHSACSHIVEFVLDQFAVGQTKVNLVQYRRTETGVALQVVAVQGGNGFVCILDTLLVVAFHGVDD